VKVEILKLNVKVEIWSCKSWYWGVDFVKIFIENWNCKSWCSGSKHWKCRWWYFDCSEKDSNVIADIVNVSLVNDDIVEVDKISLFYLNRWACKGWTWKH
jgi:hypothetical protein